MGVVLTISRLELLFNKKNKYNNYASSFVIITVTLNLKESPRLARRRRTPPPMIFRPRRRRRFQTAYRREMAFYAECAPFRVFRKIISEQNLTFGISEHNIFC